MQRLMMGKQSVNTKDADANGDEPGREGLGNFAEDQTDNKNPSDLGDAVGGNLP
jgi:hypothetical protein